MSETSQFHAGVTAAFLAQAKAMAEMLLDSQAVDTLEDVRDATLAGASLVLELTYPPSGTPDVRLLLAYPNGTRVAVTRVDFVAAECTH